MNDLAETRLGILRCNQATDWPSYKATALLVDRLGYDHARRRSMTRLDR